MNNKIIKYKTGWTKTTSIDKVSITRETPKFVVFSDGKREAKTSEWIRYHNSYEEAKQFLINRTQGTIDTLEYKIKTAKALLLEIEKLEEEQK